MLAVETIFPPKNPTLEIYLVGVLFWLIYFPLRGIFLMAIASLVALPVTLLATFSKTFPPLAVSLDNIRRDTPDILVKLSL